jgi:hypothetical protein
MGTVQWAGLKAPDPEIAAEKLLATRAEIAVAAGNSTMYHDFFASFHVVNFAAGFDYYSSGVGTGDVR